MFENLTIWLFNKNMHLYLFMVSIVKALSIPWRIFKIPKYISDYKQSALKFKTGTRVRKLQSDQTEVKVMIGPEAQDVLGIPESERSETESVELKPRKFREGTAIYSFFVNRDVWAVESRNLLTLSEWLYLKVVLGVSGLSSGSLILRPIDSTKIIWPSDFGYGTNRISYLLELLEVADD